MVVKTGPKDEPVDTVLLSPPKKTAKSPGDQQAALKSITEYRRATAWEIHRWPLTKFIVEDKTKIHMPRSYMSMNGVDVKSVWAETDLNQFVHSHYMELVDMAALPENAANFVSEGNILARRHEFLGPDPRIAGYSYDNYGDIHIKWWDKFLQEQWVDNEKWKFELEMSDEGEWVPKDLH